MQKKILDSVVKDPQRWQTFGCRSYHQHRKYIKLCSQNVEQPTQQLTSIPPHRQYTITMVLSEIFRFVLPSHRNSDFLKLRVYLSLYGGIQDQYFGYMIAPSVAALPIRKQEMCWVIRMHPRRSMLYIFQSLTIPCRVAARLGDAHQPIL